MKDVSIGAGRGRTAERRRNGSDLHKVTPPGSQSASPEAEGEGGGAAAAAVRGNRKLLQSVRSDVNVSSTQRKKEKNRSRHTDLCWPPHHLAACLFDLAVDQSQAHTHTRKTPSVNKTYPDVCLWQSDTAVSSQGG